MSAARVLSAFLVARAAFGLAFLAQSLGALPVLLYAPLERRFTVASAVEGPPGLWMAWFGATGFALLAALAGGGLALLAASRGPLARAEGAASLARAVGLMMLVDYAYFGWALTHQTPAPLPLPAWYCPR